MNEETNSDYKRHTFATGDINWADWKK